MLVFWVFEEVESEEFEFPDAGVWSLGPENVTLGSVSELKGHERVKGKVKRYHLIDVGFDIFERDVAVLF